MERLRILYVHLKVKKALTIELVSCQETKSRAGEVDSPPLHRTKNVTDYGVLQSTLDWYREKEMLKGGRVG